MWSFIKQHWPALIMALMVGVLVVLPDLVSISKSGSNFHAVYPMFNDDESYYLSTTKEVYEGHFKSGNTFIAEHKGDPALQPLYTETLVSFEAKLLNVSVPEVFVLNDFFLPVVGLLLIYILFLSLTDKKSISTTLAFLFHFVFLSSFNRPINPQLSFIFFLLGVLLVWKVVSKRYDFKQYLVLNVLLGLVFSLLVYVYPFYWTSILVLYGVSSLTFAWVNRDLAYCFKNWFIFGLTSIVFLIPYGLGVLRTQASPFLEESLIRNGLVFTHWPGAFFSAGFLILCFPIVYLLRGLIEDKARLVFCYSLIISGLALNWQNVITGKILQFSSHYYLTTVLFVFLIFAICTQSLLEKYRKTRRTGYKTITAVSLLFILSILILYKQKGEFIGAFENIFTPPDISKMQELSPALDWLNENTPKDSVVYSLGGSYDIFVPMYTADNVYTSGYAGMSLMSDSELENRWAVGHFWENVDADMIKHSQRSIWINEFQDTYANKEVRRKILQFITKKIYPETVLIDQGRVEEVLNKYKQFKKAGFEKALKTYRVDYLILDTDDVRYVGLEKELKVYSFLQITAHFGNTIIYKVN